MSNFYQIDTKTTHYLINVLRYRVGDNFTGFDGCGNTFNAEIVALENKRATVTLTPLSATDCESTLSTHLVQALPKSDKMDYIIQKSTELGVNQITPIRTEFTEVKLDEARYLKKHHHWQQILISACEQCGRNQLPTLNALVNFREFISQSDKQTLIMHPENSKPLSQIPLQEKKITVMIGPEGGFSDAEIEFAVQHGIQSVSFGPRLLRTETAGPAVIAALQTLWGDLG